MVDVRRATKGITVVLKGIVVPNFYYCNSSIRGFFKIMSSTATDRQTRKGTYAVLHLRYSMNSTTNCVRFQVLTAARIKFRVFSDIATCCFIRVNRRFIGAYFLQHQGDDRGSTHL
jgi:hypothetical protein